jgi:hypothetical protein
VIDVDEFQEGAQGAAELNEEDPAVVEQVLRFLYTGSYGGDCSCELRLHTLPGSPEYKSLTANISQTMTANLLTDVRVYILGDYLDVPALKQQALNNVHHRLRVHFKALGFLEPISEALANTKSDDPGLRPAVVSYCAAHHRDVQKCPELVTLLQDNEPLAWKLLCETQQTKEMLLRDMVVTESEVESLRGHLEAKTKELERANENIKTTVKLLGKTDKCRNETCNKDFGANLEVYANGYVKGLRCRRCKCRHTHLDPARPSGT